MATAFRSHFHRGAGAAAGERRVGDMLSDSSDDGSPLGGDVRRNLQKKPTPGRLNDSASDSLQGNGAVAPRTAAATKAESMKNEHSGTDKKNPAMEKKKTQLTMLEPKKKTFGSQSRSQSTWAIKRNTGKKWYSDSEEEEEELAVKKKYVKSEVKSNQDEGGGSDLDSSIAGSMIEPPGRNNEEPAAEQLRPHFKQQTTERKERVSTGGSVSDKSGKGASSLEPPAAHDTAKKTNVLRLLAKTRTMLPCSKQGKEFGTGVPGSPAASSSAAGKSKRDIPLASEHSALDTPPTSNISTGRPAEVQTGGNRIAPTILINRWTDQLKHSASGSEYSGSPRLAISSNDEILSPGLRKVPGAFSGRPGSGVLLEGWLRQKQRRGMKGLKKWNLRYFVLYARSNEVRYYADVVQSAWGPIPLGEIGSISLRLIQRIGKLSHPKYKGCRFDITCRNSWGTHYADDYVSSDEENASSNNNTSTNSNNEKTGAIAASKQEKGGTPRSSRVYSLVADSPQITVAWVNMLDSLLTRSANSPRPDVSSPAKAISGTSNVGGRTQDPRPVVRQRSSALDTESFVILGPGESVPKATIYAINFIFDSTPGIETEKFYEVEPDATKLKTALKFLNEFAGEAVTRKPTKDELEELLDAITASAIVRLWLKQLEQPLIPFTMYDDFEALAREAQTAPFDLRRNLHALLKALPKKNLTMLACLLFHLNDVNVYSSKNGMDAARLAHHFAEFILRPPNKGDNSKGDVTAVCHLVEEMITNVDMFIDEKEAQLLEDNRL